MQDEKGKDPLLSEMQGKGPLAGEVANVDVPAKKVIDPLEIKKEALPTPVQLMDRKHATRYGGQGYSLTVSGEFIMVSKDYAGKKIAKAYSESFNVPKLDAALSVVKNKLLTPRLQKTYPGFVSVRTHEISNVKPLTADTPESNNIRFMTRANLVKFVAEYSAPLNPEEYPKTEDLRDSIVDWKLNPKKFEEREKKRQADRLETAELDALNPGGDDPAADPLTANPVT